MDSRVSGTRRDGSSGARSRFPVLSVALFVGVLAIFGDLARGGPLLRLDAEVAGIWQFQGPYDYPFADGVDRIGQRLICLPLLFLVAYLLSRRIRSIRPLVIAVGATFALNLVVGLLKLASGRESPRTGGPALFVGDNVLFPSGHTANVIFVYGLIVALLVRYGQIRAHQRRLLMAAVGLVGVVMTVVSVYRHTHWLSDLVAGAMIGGAMLELSLTADREWHRLVGWLRRLAGPTWVVVEWVVRRIRPRIVPPAPAGRPPRRSDAEMESVSGPSSRLSGPGRPTSGPRAPKPSAPARLTRPRGAHQDVRPPESLAGPPSRRP
ncbi:phosphatase PAP2 family protein [Actinopolymorpha alba]|uniref:phosphatase PAP2 family protein n=1 Tax=Actinopolymorpha alba TaxID=533267 RepID=UPI000376071C|nr:phosphatase PAP2 family protein [Actinopolymorpha alba]